MTVESGLDLLKGLKELRVVDLSDLEVYVDGEPEQSWFKEHWPLAKIITTDYTERSTGRLLLPFLRRDIELIWKDDPNDSDDEDSETWQTNVAAAIKTNGYFVQSLRLTLDEEGSLHAFLAHCCPSTVTNLTLAELHCFVDFDAAAGEALLKHANTLEVIRMCCKSRMGEETIDSLLCTAPHLKEAYFCGDHATSFGGCLDASEIVNSEWVCENLEVFGCQIVGIPRPYITRYIDGLPTELHVREGSPQESVELQRWVYAKLARFTKLR
ncbi:hypothetical protein BGW39_009970 [Mortierella sp. 14UC]|nr:hypothetical protein BGW39_009970 [Mortierella sp. 14UC]